MSRAHGFCKYFQGVSEKNGSKGPALLHGLMTAGVPRLPCKLTSFKSVLEKLFTLKLLILFNIDFNCSLQAKRNAHHTFPAMNLSFPCFIPLLCEYSLLTLFRYSLK